MSMTKRLLSFILLLSLLLPSWIGLMHSFHDHDTTICYAKTEQHVHQEKTNCNQLHYFNQTLSAGEIGYHQIPFDEIINQNPFNSEFDLTPSSPKAVPDRGPPVITVL